MRTGWGEARWGRGLGDPDTVPPVSELAAWLAENGPISVAINAFGMQVRPQPLLQVSPTPPSLFLVSAPYSFFPAAVLPPWDLPPTAAPLQPLVH